VILEAGFQAQKKARELVVGLIDVIEPLYLLIGQPPTCLTSVEAGAAPTRADKL